MTRAARWAFRASLAAVAVAVVLWPPHTVDGPAHVLGARVLADWSGHGIYRELYVRDAFPTPNLASSWLLAALVKAGSLRAAETAVQLACVLGLPLALRYAVRGVRGESAWLALAAVPLSFGYLFCYGFYNFCLGMALCLVCAGWALRYAPAWSPRAIAGLAALLVATWFTHLVPFALALLYVGALALAGPRTVRAYAAPALAALPGLALTAAYVAHTRQGEGPAWSGVPGLAAGLVTLQAPLVTYTRAELVVSVGLAAGLVALGVRAARARAGGGRGPLLALALATALYLAAPNSFGVDFGLINERLSYFPVLFGVLWLAATPWGPRVAAGGTVALVAAAAVLFAVRVPDLRAYDRLADEYASAARWVPPGSALVALRYAEFAPGGGRNAHFDPVRHLSSGLAAATHSVDVGHYEAVFDYFPAQFRPGRDLRRAIDPTLAGLPAVPPQVDLGAAERLAGRRIDVVLLVGADRGDEAPGSAAAAAAVRAWLGAHGYARAGVTGPSGLVEVWK